MQGWSDGADPPGLAQDLRPQHHRAHGPHLHLLLWVLRLQKRSPLHVRVPIRGKPHVQDKPTLGLLLVLSKTKSVFNLFFFHLAPLFFFLKLISALKMQNYIGKSGKWGSLWSINNPMTKKET
jgi:hypothetical protein